MTIPQSPNFWTRMGCQGERARAICIDAIKSAYGEGCEVKEFTEQGWCSCTLLVSLQAPNAMKNMNKAIGETNGSQAIVQIRPRRHSLDLSIVEEARKAYGQLVPIVRRLPIDLPVELTVFAMNLLRGVPASTKIDIQPPSSTPTLQRTRLIESLATSLARAWPSSTSPTPPSTPTGVSQHPRVDSPISEGPSWLAPCCGTVGAQIIPKLRKLSHELPTHALRTRAAQTLDALLEVQHYPTVLNHGDLIPSNILVDEETWEVTGLVDWAEAELLPFGVCFYGLDRLLGALVSTPVAGQGNGTRLVFRYADDEKWLRGVFWEALVRERPEVRSRLKDVEVMRDVGVLLWSGYAWDGGKIDRVVDASRDAEEVACLEAFLGC